RLPQTPLFPYSTLFRSVGPRAGNPMPMHVTKEQVAAVVETVRETVRRHAMFRPGERVVVGCSGGADSTALLHLLAGGLLGMELRSEEHTSELQSRENLV